MIKRCLARRSKRTQNVVGAVCNDVSTNSPVRLSIATLKANARRASTFSQRLGNVRLTKALGRRVETLNRSWTAALNAFATWASPPIFRSPQGSFSSPRRQVAQPKTQPRRTRPKMQPFSQPRLRNMLIDKADSTPVGRDAFAQLRSAIPTSFGNKKKRAKRSDRADVILY